MLPEKGLVRRSAFQEEVPFATNTLQRMVKRGEFPAPHTKSSSGRLYYYNAEEVWAFIRGTWKPTAPAAAPE